MTIHPQQNESWFCLILYKDSDIHKKRLKPQLGSKYDFLLVWKRKFNF